MCHDCAMLAVYAMRSVGIPVATIEVPHWGTKGGSHVCNVVFDNNGFIYDFLGTEADPGNHLQSFFDYIPKVYMNAFGKQESSLAMLHGEEEIPPYFMNPYLKDLTNKLASVRSKDVSVPLGENIKRQFAYLCVFDIQGWIPVAWGKIEEGKAFFPAMGTNVVYHAAIYQNGKLRLKGNPFLLDEQGAMHTYTPQVETFNHVLERKNPESNAWEHVSRQLIGGVFQGADNPEFKNAITYYTIEEEPDLKYITVKVNSSVPVNYVRYRSSASTRGNMGEVEFYEAGSDIPLKGKAFGKYVPSDFFPRNGVEYLFDNNPLTFFHSLDSLSWGALKLERPTRIDKIRYIMRNDDNGIRKGEEYELYYMKNGEWISLGRQTAMQDDSLLYKGIPKGALYWLHNHTKGREERIFEINEKGEVIWR